jgi:hypothetical protein
MDRDALKHRPAPTFADMCDGAIALICWSGLVFAAGWIACEQHVAKRLKEPLLLDTRPAMPAAEVTPMRWQCTKEERRRVEQDAKEYTNACAERKRGELIVNGKG